MRTIHTIAELRSALAPHRARQQRIGFVPTMGALHEGHLSLVRLAKLKADVTVVSIFVNPKQFGPSEDFEKYPRTLAEDAKKLVGDDIDFLFVPSAEEIYPAGASVTVKAGSISELYEGAIRPGHFDGVATVVASLFNIVQPTAAFFGQKDAQQVAVIKRMVKDLHMAIEIVVGSTVREADKLAMSSRNRFLDPEARRGSVALSQALEATRATLIKSGNLQVAKSTGLASFGQFAQGQLDYLDIVDSETFHPLTSFEPLVSSSGDHDHKMASATIIIAARFGSTRLIDNVVV